MKLSFRHLLLTISVLCAGGLLFSADQLEITPQEFDFGWCPDNAKITAEFTVKNTSSELIALTSVQPACGCTAANFTPANLASSKETKISLVFDTRGYKGVNFHKGTQIKAGSPEQEYRVVLTGTGVDPKAQVYPEGSGVVHFSEDNKNSKATINIVNKSTVPIELSYVQKPASWINLDYSSESIAPGSFLPLQVEASGDFSIDRNTSVTFEALGEGIKQRLTVAFLSGKAPSTIRGIKPVGAPKNRVSPLQVPTPQTGQ